MINFSLSFLHCFEVTDGGRRDPTGRKNKKVLKDPVETERVIRNFDLWEKENNSRTDLNNNNNNNNNKTFSRNSFF